MQRTLALQLIQSIVRHTARRRPSATSFAHNARRRTELLDAAIGPVFEQIERRTMFSTFTVTNVNDGGAGSLRDAITQANATPNVNNQPDLIDFGIAGGGAKTIALRTALPEVTDAALVDGFTQPGSSANTLSLSNGDNAVRNITIDGSAAPAGSSGLALSGHSSTVRGLRIANFFADADHVHGEGIVVVSTVPGEGGHVIEGNELVSNDTGVAALIDAGNNTIGGTSPASRNLVIDNGDLGIRLASDDNAVQNNYVGIGADGVTGAPNSEGGIRVQESSNNRIEGNVISGNSSDGVQIISVVKGDGNQILANLIGTTANGLSALPNGSAGIELQGNANKVQGNLIAGNQVQGVVVNDGTGDTIQHNFIGTDVNGLLPLANATGILVRDADRLVIKDNLLSGNTFDGIEFNGSNSNTVVQGNLIGVKFGRTEALPNGVNGIGAFAEMTGALIGGASAGEGNVISGNVEDGISLSSNAISGTRIFGNRIGTTADGTAKIGNGNDGVELDGAFSNFVGGPNAGEGNVISGNDRFGVLIHESGNSRNVVQGNRIGTNAAGDAALGNGGDGIQVVSSFNNTIGGTTAGARNVVAGNGGDGIEIRDSAVTLVQGNFIGTNAAGTAALGNKEDGVFVDFGSSSAQIGGTEPGAGNLLSGNGFGGIDVDFNCSFNTIQGNRIGTDVTGTADLGNGLAGIFVISSSSNLIGGSVAEAGNIIAFNHGPGVSVIDDAAPTRNNAIRQNSIFGNTTVAIDLNEDGITANDPFDADGGTNDGQNFPVLTSAVSANGATVVQGAINSTPNTILVLDFYSDTQLNAQGYAQGRTYLGSATVTTDVNGNATFNVALASGVPAGQFVTATANTIDTDPFADTSEFSSPRVVTAPPPPPPPPLPQGATLSVNNVTVTEGDSGTKSMTFTITRAGDVSGAASVTVATADGTAKSGKDYNKISGKLVSFAAGQTSKTVTVQIVGDKVSEPLNEQLVLNLSAATGATITDGQGVGTIVDNEKRLVAKGKTLQAQNLKTHTFTNEDTATFTSGDFSQATDFTAVIDWGDGTTSNATIALKNGVWETVGTHTYAKGGSFNVLTTITDKNGVTVTVKSTMKA